MCLLHPGSQAKLKMAANLFQNILLVEEVTIKRVRAPLQGAYLVKKKKTPKFFEKFADLPHGSPLGPWNPENPVG